MRIIILKHLFSNPWILFLLQPEVSKYHTYRGGYIRPVIYGAHKVRAHFQYLTFFCLLRDFPSVFIGNVSIGLSISSCAILLPFREFATYILDISQCP